MFVLIARLRCSFLFVPYELRSLKRSVVPSVTYSSDNTDVYLGLLKAAVAAGSPVYRGRPISSDFLARPAIRPVFNLFARQVTAGRPAARHGVTMRTS